MPNIAAKLARALGHGAFAGAIVLQSDREGRERPSLAARAATAIVLTLRSEARPRMPVLRLHNVVYLASAFFGGARASTPARSQPCQKTS
jgi:hypothetical protein